MSKKNRFLFVAILSVMLLVGQIVHSLIREGTPMTMKSVIAILVGWIVGTLVAWWLTRLFSKLK